MALESFYGGKQGISPVIKASFEYLTNEKDSNNNYLDSAYGAAVNNADASTIAAIDAKTLSVQFSNPNYQDVWFGELAIIDTTNKFNPNNGKIYRRVLKTTQKDDENFYAGQSAEYIGQIVGPAGGIPRMNFTSIDGVRGQINNSSNTIISFPSSQTDMDTNKQNSLVIKETTMNNQLVPGKDDEDNFNDAVKYTWVNILPPDGTNNTSYVYLGFEIPYPVFNLSTETVNYTQSASITRTSKNIEGDIEEGSQSDSIHPFYWAWNLQIPRGIRGIWQEIHIGNKSPWIFTKNNPLYSDINDLTYNEQSDTYSIKIYENETEPRKKNSTDISEDHFWYLTVKCPCYKKNKTLWVIEEYNFYLEPYKNIKEIKFDQDNGDITFKFDDNNDDKKIIVETDINFIEKVYGDYNLNAFYILYSSSKARPNDDETLGKIDYTDSNGQKWKKDADGLNKGKYWLYVSPLIDYGGLRIFSRVNFSNNITSSDDAIAYLNDTYKKDSSEAKSGKILLGEIGTSTYGFYFDPSSGNDGTWVSLGQWDAVKNNQISIYDIRGTESTSNKAKGLIQESILIDDTISWNWISFAKGGK